MFRRIYLPLVVVLTVVLSGAVLVINLVGATSTHTPPPLRDLDACGLPCWRGIVPNETPLRDAEVMLLESGYALEQKFERYNFNAYQPHDSALDCAVRLGYSSQRVTVVALTHCENVRLGDVIHVLGDPDGVLPSGSALSFHDGLLTVTMSAQPCEAWFSPDGLVSSIYLAPLGTTSLNNRQAFTQNSFVSWHGFTSHIRYRQLEPVLPAC